MQGRVPVVAEGHPDGVVGERVELVEASETWNSFDATNSTVARLQETKHIQVVETFKMTS